MVISAVLLLGLALLLAVASLGLWWALGGEQMAADASATDVVDPAAEGD